MKTTSKKPAKAEPASLPPHVCLLYESLETEMGGVEVYTNALACVQNDALRDEWQKYLAQTKRHVEIVRDALSALAFDPDRDTPGRQVVRHIGKALVGAMQMAKGAGDLAQAEIVAAECVTLAETKDHANWSLLEKLAGETRGKERETLDAAQSQVENEEDEHLYHSKGWARELWRRKLGLDAQLPPPEEAADVHDPSGAAAAEARAHGRERGRGRA